MPLERLQKIIAAAGIASRRKAEELIQAGLVSVNGTVITELGSKADPDTDSIRVNSKLLQGPERHEYIALNKPRGYVTTVSDPEGRPTVMELVRSRARLYPIGRLDFNSEGLLLLTNDGSLAHKLMKAASHIPKTYLVKVAGQPAEDQLRRLRTGVSIVEERNPSHRVRTAPAQIRVIKEADNPWLEVTLHEGRNRQIRKMFEEIGHHVEKIRRVRYGPLELDLQPGESRPLTTREVSRLQHATNPEVRREKTDQGGRRFRKDRPAPRRDHFGSADEARRRVPERERQAPQFESTNRPQRENRERSTRTSDRFDRRERGPKSREFGGRLSLDRKGKDSSKSFAGPRQDRDTRKPEFHGRHEGQDRRTPGSFKKRSRHQEPRTRTKSSLQDSPSGRSRDERKRTNKSGTQRHSRRSNPRNRS